MKKIYVIVLLLSVFTINCICQSVTNYSFTTATGTFTPITGTSFPALTGSTDDGYWNNIPIGFRFWYMGTGYNTVSASTNGWLTLGANITDYQTTNSLSAGGAPRPVLAPLWDDLDIQNVSNAVYSTTGTAGSRIFTLQFLNNKWNYQGSGAAISFQVLLYEGTGKIEYRYRRDATAANTPSASIGLSSTSTGSGNFLSVNDLGNGVSSTAEANVTSKPATGNVYAFTPPIPAVPASLIFSAVTNASITLNWSDLSSNESGFIIYKSTDNINFTLVTQTAANVTSSIQSGLSPSTLYYWRIYALSEGGLSATALSGSKATTCTPPAAPGVTSPVNYCQNATASVLSATGTGLLWGGASGSAGGTSALGTTAFVDNGANNKKLNFTTTGANTTISSVDFYITPFQAVSGIVLSLYNAGGTVIATSSTITTLTAGAASVKISNTFNYNIVAAGDYSIGISAGSGNIGSDNPVFPISEPTGTINITGGSVSGIRCFNNIQFTTTSSATAPTPSTLNPGVFIYLVSQTVGGCVSPQSTITVNVSSPNLSQVPTSGLAANYKFNGNANDANGNNNGTLQNAPALTPDRFNVTNKAYSFNGSTQYMSTTLAYNNPPDFSISIWFKTNTVTGGRLIGFGNAQTGQSGNYDRHIYMNNSGQVYFGVYPNTVVTINSPLAYNDNNWHLATATLSSTSGMALYVDGALVSSNPATTTAQNYTGYWRIGFDNNGGWTSQPSSFYFNGALDDALIYTRALTAAEATTLYKSPDGAGNNGPACAGSTVSLSATTLSGASYAWSGPNGFTSAAQNPTLAYTAVNAGIYTLVATVAGCTTTAYTTVLSSSNAGQWTGSVSTDWANAGNWCSGVIPTSATNVIIGAGAANMPSIISSVFCNSLTINVGATVTVSNTGTINIAGTLTNSGTFTDNGTTNFNGTSGQQTYTGVPTFNNLTVSNASGLLLSMATIVKSNLTISAGTLNANGFNISLAGNWVNNASATAFTAGTRSVTFNSTSAKSIGGTFTTTFYDLIIADTGSTVSLAVNASIANNLLVSVGTFDLAAFSANRVTAGGSLTVSNNATLRIGSTNTFPINYTTNSLATASTVAYAGTNQTISNQTYGNLTVSSSTGAAIKTFPATALTVVGNLTSILGTGTAVSFNAASDITVNGNVSIGASTTFDGGAFSHSIGGNWANSGVFTGNASTVTFTGTGKSVSGTGTQNFNNLTVAAALVTFAGNALTVNGNLATTGAGSFSQAAGATLTMTGAGKTITGTGITLENLFISGTVSTAASFTLTGNLSAGGSFTASAGTLTMSGTTKSISGAGTISFATLSATGTIATAVNFSVSTGLTVTGSLTASAGTATFTGTSTLSGTANLFNTNINGTSLQLSTNSILGIANVLTITTGTLNVTSSAPNTVQFNGAGAQSINAITYSNLVLSNGNTKTAAGNITTAYDISIGTGTTFNAVSYTIIIFGSWINSGIFTAGTSNVQFEGPATAYVTGATTFNILTSNTTSITTPMILNNNISASVVNMINGNILTGTNTLTITNTRTGIGYIYGNIQRTHLFTTGVAYAFEGPDNTITFSSVTGVSSVTVSVVKLPISDFPFGGSISRQYTIAVPAGTYNATLRLHYEDVEVNGNNESSMGLWQYNGSLWVPIGKTANSTTSNYVEQSGLTNITNRWTCSDNQNVVQWNGSVSTDWNTAANWTTIQGSGSRPPTASDIVNLGTAAFTNQPTISTAVNVKNIIFGSVQAVTLSMAAGSLTSGDIIGNWTANTTHTINVNNQTININGDLTLGDGISLHAINVNIGTGTINIADELAQRSGANIVFSGAGSLNIGGNYFYTNGTFTPGAGTVTYNGAISQAVGAVGYNHLTINKSLGFATINSPINIAGNLVVTAGQLDNTATTFILGNVLISPGGILQNQNILHVGGNWTNNGTYSSVAASIFFDGSGTQNISSSTFTNFTVNKPVGSSAILTGNIVINGDLNVTSGTLDIQTFNCNRSVQGGTATLAGAGTLIIGANNPPMNYSGYAIANTCTVIFNGTSAQTLNLPGISLGHLVLRNGGIKTLASPITVSGNLTIESGANLNAGSNAITLNGNWINSGTFTPSTGTVLFTSPVIKTISGGTPTTFNHITVSGIDSILTNITVNGLLTITNTGNFRAGSAILVTMNGDLLNSGILYNLGTTTFTGNVLQTLSLINAVQTVAITVNFNGSVSPVLNSTSPPQYGFLNINNTGGVNPSVGWTILNNLTVGAGASFNGGISTHDLYGSLTNNGTITSSGTLNFIPATAATISMGSNFSSTGRVVFGGTGAITLAGAPVSLYRVLISNTNAAGVTPTSNWNINNNFFVSTGAKLNAGSYNYAVGGNLSNTGTINSGTSTFTMNGTVAQDIITGSPLNNLTINNTAGNVTLSTNATVNGLLNFVAGKIQTGSNSLILPLAGTVTGAAQSTGWVNGNLQKYITTGATAKTFETGDAASFTPVALAFANVTVAGNLTLSTTPGDHPNINTSTINPLKSVNRFWTVTNSGVGYNNYAATFNFVPADIDGGASTAAFGVGLYNGSTWVLPTVTSPNATNIKANGVTATGSFSIGEVCNAGTVISYPATPYCSNAGTAAVTLTGSGGGVFSSTAGLSINSATGAVNLPASTAGTYSVTYTIAASGGCPAFITSANIVITVAPAATISYSGSPYCSTAGSAAVVQIGTPGGVYSSTAIPGLVIDPVTGTIDLGASYDTTYTVTYTIAAAGGCAAYSTSTTITITTQPFASGTYNGNPYCSNGGIAFPTGTFAGTLGLLTSTPGLSIDPTTGVVDLALSTPGNYTVTYNVPAGGGCAAYSNTATVNISAAPTATISYAASPYCVNAGTAVVTSTGTPGGTFASTSGLVINPASGDITLATSTAGTYTVTYNIGASDGCAFFSTSATVTIAPVSAATINYAGSPYCANSGTATVTRTGTPGGTYSSTAGLTINAGTGAVTLASSTAGTYTVTYVVAANGCAQFSTTTTVTVSAVPSATISYAGTPYCTYAGTATVTRTGTTGGAYSSSAGLVINASTGDITLASSTAGTYTVTYTVAAAGGCAIYTATTVVQVTAILNNVLDYTNGAHATICGTAAENGTLTMTAPAGTVFINIGFASYGTPNGTCNNFTISGCHSLTSQSVAEIALLGKNSASILAGNGPFGDPCVSTVKRLYVQATYTAPICSGTAPTIISGSTPTGGNGTYVYYWEYSTTSSSAGFSAAPGTNNTRDYTPGVLTQTTWYRRSVTSLGCTDVSKVIRVTVVVAGSWTGAVNTDWNNSGNWLCGTIPTSTASVTIPGSIANYPLLNSGSFPLQNVTIQSGASLTVSGATLQIAGSITNAGTLNASAGTIEMNGSSPQTIPANAFANNTLLNLVINNNVTLAGQDTLTGTLTIGSSGKTFATAGFLVLKSTAAATALVAPLPVDGTGAATSFITGNVTVERYIPNRRAWRLLTSPLSATGPIYDAWQNGGVNQVGKGMFITGPNPGATTGLDASFLNTISLKSFNPVTQAFLNITNTKTTNLSNSAGSADNIGYFAFVRGDRNPNNLFAPNSNSTTLRSTGKLQTGKQVFAASVVYNSFTIMGNPYASPVDFNNIERNHLIKRFFTWDATSQAVGAYITIDDINGDGIYSYSDPTTLQTKYIQSGQAFFVQTDTAGTANLTYYESSKSALRSNAGFRPQGQILSLAITLNMVGAASAIAKADAILAEFDTDFSAGVNLQDAPKFTNTNETLSFLRDGASLSIERKPVINSDDTLFLKLIQTTQRNYQFALTAINLDQPGLLAFLEDSYTSLATPVSLQGSTDVNFTIDGNAASADANRFRVVFKKAVVLPVTYSDVKAWQAGKNIAVQWAVENQLNILRYEVEKSTDGIHFASVGLQPATGGNGTAAIYNWLDLKAATGDNFYRIRNIDLDGKTAYSKVVKVTVGTGPGEITVYPNPVTGGNIGLQMSNMPAGKYVLRLSNPIGQEILTKEIIHAGGNASEKIRPSKYFARGMYTLEITHPDKHKTNISVVNQ